MLHTIVEESKFWGIATENGDQENKQLISILDHKNKMVREMERKIEDIQN